MRLKISLRPIIPRFRIPRGSETHSVVRACEHLSVTCLKSKVLGSIPRGTRGATQSRHIGAYTSLKEGTVDCRAPPNNRMQRSGQQLRLAPLSSVR
jgi:hypothetical protein